MPDIKAGVGKFFTVGTFGTLLGSVAILTIVVNVMYDVFGVGSKPLSLCIAVAISVLMCVLSTTETGKKLVQAFVVAVLNGVLIYATAYGIDMSVIAAPDHAPAATAPVEKPAEPKTTPPTTLRKVGPFGNRIVTIRPTPVRKVPLKPE